MNSKTVWLIGLSGLIPILVIALLIPAESSTMPPTPAFSKIRIDNYVIEAPTFDSQLDLSNILDYNGSAMTLEGDSAANSFSSVVINGKTITASNPDSILTINTLGSLNTTVSGSTVTIKLKALTCGLLQGIKGVDASGNLFCAVI